MDLEDRAIALDFRTGVAATAPTKFHASLFFGGDLAKRQLREPHFLRQQGWQVVEARAVRGLWDD